MTQIDSFLTRITEARVKQLTIRGFDDRLRACLEDLARQRGISLNKAALILLRRGAGLGSGRLSANVVGDALDEFVGSWPAEEEMELLSSIEALEKVDPELWQ